MKNTNPIYKKISKKDRRISLKDSSYLLAEFFNGQIINLDEGYVYES